MIIELTNSQCVRYIYLSIYLSSVFSALWLSAPPISSRPHLFREDLIMASGRSGADIAKGTAGSFAPATKDAASELASKTVGLVTPAA